MDDTWLQPPISIGCSMCTESAARVEPKQLDQSLTDAPRASEVRCILVIYRCPQGHQTQALFDHTDGALQISEPNSSVS